MFEWNDSLCQGDLKKLKILYMCMDVLTFVEFLANSFALFHTSLFSSSMLIVFALTLCWAQHGRLFTSCRAGLVELRSLREHTGSFAQLLQQNITGVNSR